MTQSFELDDTARGRERKPRRCFILIVDYPRKEHLGARGEPAVRHLFGITHQLVEVDFWCGNKCSDAAAALNDSFPFKGGERVTRGHQAHLMNLGEVAFRGDSITGMQLAGFDALANSTLDSLIR